MNTGRTIIDYPSVDSFFDEVELLGRKDLETGFSSHPLFDPYVGRGRVFNFTTKSKTTYGFEIAFGFTDSLFKLDVELTPPFNSRVWNTRGDENNHSLFPLRTAGIKLCLLFTQLNIGFTRQ
jgi:hypothetical protein